MRSMRAMHPLHLVVRIRCLLLVCVTLLILHGLTGHAHADLLVSVPVTDHVPGDDHHHAAGGSCEMARTPTADVDGAVEAPVRQGAAVVIAPRALASAVLGAGETSYRPPLFLLHAALLI